jgi:aminoglycoside/choline kinase family phosphotransferase
MDAPWHADCRPFVKVARLFREAGVNVPKVLAEDIENGYLLLSDLGTTLYLDVLSEQTASSLYGAATNALLRIQLTSRPGMLPEYDRELLLRELRLFPDWYVAKHLGLALSELQARTLGTVFESILANNLARRAYCIATTTPAISWSEDNPGIIDFQDAVYGPITYDVVSLFKDAYITWDEEQVIDWVVRYWENAKRAGLPVDADFGSFYRDFEWMGVQRHIKVLGIFARLFYRDGKERYLQNLPLVMAYVRKTCQRYNGLGALLRLLDALDKRQPAEGYTF